MDDGGVPTPTVYPTDTISINQWAVKNSWTSKITVAVHTFQSCLKPESLIERQVPIHLAVVKAPVMYFHVRDLHFHLCSSGVLLQFNFHF